MPLDTRLARQARETFVGREEELAALHSLLGREGPLVAHVHGIPGAGKSTLLARFADEARDAGATVLLMDCRLIEPTPRGFLSEMGQQTGALVETLDDAAATLGRGDGVVVLALDHYETFLLLDTWLRQTLLPALPDPTRLVLASRQPPVPLWTTSPRWHGLFKGVALEPLDREASLELLKSAGVEEGEAEPLAAVAHGNPLALKMAASAARGPGPVTVQDSAIQEVMQQLTTYFLQDVDDPAAREALSCACVARRITRSLLRALPEGSEHSFDSLEQLPFIDAWRDGLRMHDAVREAMARTLRASDPERFHECRRRAWRQLREALRSVPRSDVWRYTADMLYLIENPVVREAFFPSGHQELGVEPAQVGDQEAIRGIAAEQEGPEAVAVLERWWKTHPLAFRVVRDREGAVVGFYCMCEASELTDAVRQADPVAAAWSQHLDEQPLAGGDTALFLRRWLARESGEAPSPEQAACWLDVKRTYMELRPALRRVYLTVVDLPTYAPVAVQLGFQHLADQTVELDATPYQTAMLDFGPASVDGWITRLVGDELGVVESGPLDRERRALVLDGQEVALTPLEFKLAEYLEDLGGATATRDQLLDDVWGHADGSGSSNVVDAVVKSLRRKLGAESGRVETVRGFGYRWRKS